MNNTFIVVFPELTLNASMLEEYGGFEPQRVFEIQQNTTSEFYCYDTKADETFWGKSIDDIAKKISNFLEGDQVVAEVGKYEVRSIIKNG